MMFQLLQVRYALPAAIVALAFAAQATAADAARPNFLLILADDMGFSDLGCYGGEIRTPVLDQLAAGGLKFTQFYNTGRCWPTRAVLLTGYYPQMVRRDVVPGVVSGGRGVRPDWAPLLPVRLRKLGYRCYHSGKWHFDGMPLGNGFDRSYYLRDQSRFFSPQVHHRDDVKLPPVARGSGYYATTAIAEHAMECLQEHAREHSGKPFFHYLAFTAPHFPLHALPEDIARYQSMYREGWRAVRADRWKRIQEMKLVSPPLSQVETNVGPPYHFPDALKILGPGEVNRPLPWEKLSPQQQAFQTAKMQLHAAMIDRLDRETGRVIGQLKKMGAFDNTLILFLSDNGASAEIMVRADGHDPRADAGSAATYLCLGPGWSTTCNTPFRRHKTWVHEGGIATPLIAHWPAGISARGELRRTPGHVIDITPTLLELAGAAPGSNRPPEGAPRRPGRSLAPVFGKETAVNRDYLWWLHEGNRALRQGDWKIVAAKGDPWELYNLARDRCETKNLAAKEPGKVSEMAAAWEKEFARQRKAATGPRIRPAAPPKPQPGKPGKSKPKAGKPKAPQKSGGNG